VRHTIGEHDHGATQLVVGGVDFTAHQLVESLVDMAQEKGEERETRNMDEFDIITSFYQLLNDEAANRIA
jgi:hypothetical protein